MSFNYQAAVNINAEFKGASAVENARKSIKNLDDTTKGMSKGFGEAAAALKGFVAAFVLDKIIKGSVESVKSTIELGQQMHELSQKTGIGVTSLLSLKAAAENSGVDIAGLATGLKKLAVSQVEAGGGSKELQAAFKAIGISVADVKNLKTDELVFKIADQFEKFADGPQKAAVAVKIFGKAGTDLIPILNEGGAAIKKLGLQMSNEFASNAQVLDETFKQIGRNFEQSKINLVEGILPALQQTADAFDKFTKPAAASSKGLEDLNAAIKITALVFAALAEAVIIAGDAIVSGFAIAIKQVKSDIENDFDRISTLVKESKAIATLGFSDLSKIEADYRARSSARERDNANDIKTATDGLSERTKARFDAIVKLKNDISAPAPTKSGPAASNESKQKINYDGAANAKEIDAQRDALEKYKISETAAITLEQEKIDSLGIHSVAVEKNKIAIEEKAKADKEFIKFQGEMRVKADEATASFIKQKQHLIDLAEQNKQSFGVGAKQAMAEYVENARNVAAQTKALFLGAFGKIEDALVAFVKTGKLNFKDLADFVETELIRIAVRRAIISPIVSGISSLAGATASANGNIMTKDGPLALQKYASGGIARSPQLSLFGEGSKPEAYVPLPDGRSIPVTMKGQGSGGSNVSVNINIDKSGGTTNDTTSDSQKGKQLGTLIQAAIRQELVTQRRPGGLLA